MKIGTKLQPPLNNNPSITETVAYREWYENFKYLKRVAPRMLDELRRIKFDDGYFTAIINTH